MVTRKGRDAVCIGVLFCLTVFVSLLFFFIFFLLISGSYPLFKDDSLTEIIFNSLWNPENGKFGLFPIIYGTILVTGVSLVIAVPISLLSAIYLTEYASSLIKNISRPFLDVLAGIPSVVYGLCAYILLAPTIRNYVAPYFGTYSTGLCILTAAITLSIMIFPIVISLSVESFLAVPMELREAALSLGATKWQMIKHVLLRVSFSSIISAILLGFSRAFGETIAVNMVVGGVARMPASLLDPGQTLASLIASAYGEMMSVPLYKSALMTIALILFVSILFFNLLARLLLMRTKKRACNDFPAI